MKRYYNVLQSNRNNDIYRNNNDIIHLGVLDI